MSTTTNTHESRHATSTVEDVEAYVPDDATTINEDTVGAPTLYLTEGGIYTTGVHCTECYCSLAFRATDGTGRVECPNCEWTGYSQI